MMLLERVLASLRISYEFCRQAPIGGGGGNASPSPLPTPIAAHLLEVPRVILPLNLAITCAVFAVLGALTRVLVEEKRARRPSRTNWLTFGISSLVGIPVALTTCEALFRTQPWARDSFFLLCCLSMVLASNGQGILMELQDGTNTAAKAIAAKGNQLLAALMTAPSKDSAPKTDPTGSRDNP